MISTKRLLGGAAALLLVIGAGATGCKSSSSTTKTSSAPVTHTTTDTGTGGGGQGGGASGGGSSTSTGTSSKGGHGQTTGAGGGGAGQGGAGGHAGEGGNAGSGGQTGQGGQAPNYLCSVNTNWTVIPGGKPVIATGEDDVLGSITPDELTIVFFSSASGTFYTSDRLDSTNSFDVLRKLPVNAGWYATTRAALSPDGLRLVVVSKDEKKLGQLTRKTRDDAFQGVPDTTPFASLMAALGADESIGDPVLATDDTKLVYSVFSAAAKTTMHVATHGNPGDAWKTSAETLSGPELDAANGKRRVPTAISSDLLTIYFWDQQKNVQRAGWRVHEADPFSYFEDYPQLAQAVPTGNCKKLYFTGDGVSNKDVLLAFPE
jgi:hypothetical protein